MFFLLRKRCRCGLSFGVMRSILSVCLMLRARVDRKYFGDHNLSGFGKLFWKQWFGILFEIFPENETLLFYDEPHRLQETAETVEAEYTEV